MILVEDNSFTRDALEVEFRRARDRNGSPVRCLGSFSTWEEAVQTIPELRPDVIVLDLTLPGGCDGVSATRQIKQLWPLTKVLVFSVAEAHDQIRAALRAGADGYLDKTSSADLVRETIVRLAGGSRVLSARAADQLVRYHQHEPAGRAELSPQETRVLEHVRAGLLDKEISDRMALSEHTVREYKRRIVEKTGAKTVREAAWLRR